MRIWVVAVSFFILSINGCAKVPQQPAYSYNEPQYTVDYIRDVKPVLVKRCVVCHSCYNSPCQLKFSHWEGIERGASKEKIYNGARLDAIEPSRLFVDAVNKEKWREKGFFSVMAEEGQSHEESFIYQLLEHKRTNPEVVGDYLSESSDLTCAATTDDLQKFLKKHPNRGMPFGFPPLSNDDFNTVIAWLKKGAPGPTDEQQKKIDFIPVNDEAMIDKWEAFLNREDPKFKMTARYLYEHLFLAHLTFETGSNIFYEIVRSYTPPGEAIDIVATVRPHDKPLHDKFYYRIRKISSTIVFKTHMVFPMGDAQFARVKELFIDTEWLQEPHVMGYGKEKSANPFFIFEQIPPRSRYQWLLDNANYVIMTFIRGPVCKGQIALNVINDHFWIAFLDPDYDLSIKYPEFLKSHLDNLRMPGEKGSEYRLSKMLLKNSHYKRAITYFKSRQRFYAKHYQDGLNEDAIWAGSNENDAPMLTVFRHFDSASVHRGALGSLPKTAWVMDYPLMERIYYALVASFDIYGDAGHQLGTRLYMDALRIEAETIFLDFLPMQLREKIMDSWYKEVRIGKVHYNKLEVETAIQFTTPDPKREFLESLVNNRLKMKDLLFDLNYLGANDTYPEIPEKFIKPKDVIQGFVAISAPGVSFFKEVTDHNANVAWIKIENIPGYPDQTVTAIVDRWHDNVKFVFTEALHLDAKKNKAHFKRGLFGSYPNYFFVVDYHDLHDFLTVLDEYDGTSKYEKMLHKYGINRADPDFWNIFDWFQEEFNKQYGSYGGVIDLNRYYYEALSQE